MRANSSTEVYNLDVERIAPIHGTRVPMTDLKTAIGQATD
jgi:hypothetical protein